MEYSELNFTIYPCNESTREILAAELSELYFEGFIETDKGFTAYIISEKFDNSAITFLLLKLKQNEIEFSYKIKTVPIENWNSEWENNINPVIVNDTCLIRAPFHSNYPITKYEILIQPNMTFGTGHHETTYMMISEMLNIDFHKKTVLDIGCGTGVLAILASKLGAKKIIAIDNDIRAYQNTIENIKLNNISNIHTRFGTSVVLENEVFDIILANIIKNCLLSDAEKYATMLVNKGILVCSGFYREDKSEIESKMKTNGLLLKNTQEKNNWILQCFIKN